MIISIILFAIGLFLLIKGGDWFVDGATGIARRFHLPELLIGATVVSIGTTLPEVMVSAQGALVGSGSMAYGNAIGSIICNTSLIAALTIAIKPSKADRKSMIIPVCFFFGAVAFYVFTAYVFGFFYRWVGLILLCGFAVYITINVIQAVKAMKKNDVDAEDIADAIEEPVDEDKQSTAGDFLGFILIGVSMIAAQIISIIAAKEDESVGFLVGVLGVIALLVGLLKLVLRGKLKLLNSNILFLVLGAGIIAVGADLLVENGTIIAKELGVPETVIALTFVALGTSLPELVTAITSLAKGHGALSLGNIIGANLFNLVLVSGVATVINPFAVPAEATIAGMPASLVLDIPVMLGATAIMVIPALIRQKLSRVQGILLLCIYAAFCTVQFVI